MQKSRIMSWNFYNCTEKFCNECEQWVCRQFLLVYLLTNFLQPIGYSIHMSCFAYFRKNVVPIGHGNSFRLVLTPGKVMEKSWKMIFLKEWSPCTANIQQWLSTGVVHTSDKTQLDFVVSKFVQTCRDCCWLVMNSVHTVDATQLDCSVASAVCIGHYKTDAVFSLHKGLKTT